MNVKTISAKSAGFLVAALWISTAIAAPLSPSSRDASRHSFDAAIPDGALVEISPAPEAGLRRQIVNYRTQSGAGSLPSDRYLLSHSQRETMRLNPKAGVLVLTLTATAVSAGSGRLETAAMGAPLEGVGEASATASRIDIPSAGASFRIGELLVSLPSNLSLEVIDALARRHGLTRLESQSVGLLGRTVHRWRIADGRSIPDVILALKLDGGIDAQPNYIYTCNNGWRRTRPRGLAKFLAHARPITWRSTS